MTERVLVTGSSGFIGGAIVNYLAKSFDVLTLSRSENSDIQVDLSRRVPVLAPVDLVVHVAGKAHISPNSKKESKDFFQVNYNGTKNLLQGIDNLSKFPKSIVLISTVAVYGLDQGENITEEQPLLGSSPYAKSKIMAENCLNEWGFRNEVKVIILRLPLVVGKHAPGNMDLLVRAIKRGWYLGIGRADNQRSMVLVEDIVKFLPRVFDYPGVYNLTDGHHPRVHQFENILSELLDRRITRVPYWIAYLVASLGNLSFGRIPLNSKKLRALTSTLTFSDMKARQVFGWNPQRVLDRLSTLTE